MEEYGHDRCTRPLDGPGSPSVVRVSGSDAENYTAHVIPFYKIDDNWSAFLVVADTSFRDLDEGGTQST